ncbi:MAG: glycosyl hydrolase, partial [Lachnospiraceae bacterium]|nr:glycosyl hydrolase [Lachnospiraceae bacterium]
MFMAAKKAKHMTVKEIKQIVAGLTLQQKAYLTTGVGSWETAEFPKKGVPKEWMCDGPHGLRKQDNNVHADINDSIDAVSFPAECAVAASWDRELIYEAAKAIGNEAQANDVQMVLGPGVNMKRSPLCGRNFEYMSEDPYLAGELGAAYVNGLQSTGVSACVKHFFANSQETDRFTSSSEMDETTERQIYLPAFETVVKKAHPGSVMAAYNKVNGTYMTENKKYLTDILRKEWGFKGMVVSDWG